MITDEIEAYVAGLVATDGHLDAANGRVRIAQGPAGHDVIRQIAGIYGRNTSYNSSNRALQVDLRWGLDWKRSKPELSTAAERHYFRGLCDGDGYLTSSQGGPGAVVGFCFNPVGEQWLGDLWQEMLTMSGYAYHLEATRPTVRTYTVSNWLHVGELAGWLYADALISLPEKKTYADRFAAEWVTGLVHGRRSWYLGKEHVFA